jgi:hypothetical protein
MAMTDIWDSISRKYGSWRHERVACGILSTPPIMPRNDGLVLFSMMGTRVLLPYLVAVKSLHAQLGRGRIVILNDGTLTRSDRVILAYHCGNPEIIELADIDTGSCPNGNCWERLLAILDRRATDYVIQIDSDTVTTGPVPDVVDAIAANRSFTLGGGAHAAEQGFMTPDDLVRKIYPGGPLSDHVQHRSEAVLDKLPDASRVKYIRGCAGFAGFAKNEAGRERASEFSLSMTALIGNTWTQWGSEQVASNFVVANDPDPLVLPYAHYINHWDEPLPANPKFIHFVGTYRYHFGHYDAVTKAAIAAL